MATHGGTQPPAGPAALAGLLRTLRERTLLSQEQLAERAGLSVRTIVGLESGRTRRPRGESVRMLADALGLSGPDRAALAAAARSEPVTVASHASAVPHAPTPAQLPADVVEFTGRRAELEELDQVLAGASQRPAAVVISAIAGTAGVGKTALAIHWAHRVTDLFPDGQLFVNLHGYAPGAPVSPLQALAQLLQGLGVAADQVPTEEQPAVGLYRSLLAGRRVLVLLDNVRNADQVRPLVPGSPGCLVLVTSRDRLAGLSATHSARRLTLDVLPPEEAVSLLAGVLGRARVAAEPEAVAQLAEVCGFLPLALRIAAANLACHPERSIAGYVAELRAGDRLGGLAVDGDAGVAVRAAFDCSLAALDPPARRVFRLLGLVPGATVTLPAAAALAAVPEGQAARLLERLAGAHLIELRGPGRYGLHDLLRCYAREQAEQEDSQAERTAALGRLLGWYLQTADAAGRLLYPERLRLPVPAADPELPGVEFAERAGALAWLDAERANLVAAVEHAADQGPRPSAWLLADALRGYFWQSRQMVDWLAVARASLAAATAEGDRQAQAAAERTLGDACECLGDYDRAAGHYRRALPLARQAGWLEGEAVILSDIGELLAELGQLQRAADCLAQALALHRRTGYKAGQATVLDYLGDVERALGRPAQAVEHLVQALALHREIGSRSGQAADLSNLGEAYRDVGQLDRAQQHLTEALALSRELGSRFGEAYGLHALATLHRDAGRHPHALELAEAALALACEVRTARLEIDARNTLGGVQLRLGRPELAAEHHRQALELACQADARYPETEALLGLAAVHRAQGQPAEALPRAQQALALAHQAGFGILEAQARTILAAAHLDLGDHDQAIADARQALEVHRQTGHRLGEARTLVTLGHALRHAGDTAAAGSCWEQAHRLLTDIGSPDADQVQALLKASGSPA
jgi:tetratricopeptide (TPR) repeat protein/transcriptional regulator with XRE-family HTH domain